MFEEPTVSEPKVVKYKAVKGPIPTPVVDEPTEVTEEDGTEAEYQPNIVQWFYDLSESWNTNPDNICKKSCLKNNTGTSFSNQFLRQIEIK